MRPFLAFLIISFLPIPALATGQIIDHNDQFSSITHNKIFTINDIDKFTIMSFWSPFCVPCLKETDLLIQTAKDHPELDVKIVSLQNKNQTIRYFATKHKEDIRLKNIEILIAPDDSKTLLRKFGDKYALLPFSVAFKTQGEICARQSGILGTEIINNWIKSC